MTNLSAKRKDIIAMIEARSPFDEKETQRIIKKYFYAVPRLVKICDRYGFGSKKVLEIGAAYGQCLFYWGEASEAVDVSARMLQMPQAAGRKIYELNIENGFHGVPKGAYDAIYTNNLFEHLVAPHLFLARLHTLLKPKGLLAIGHPVVPPFPFRQFWNLCGFNGWMEEEHVNFFTPKTAKLTIERGGFRVVDQYFSLFHHSKLLSRIALPFGVHCLSICEKADDYSYLSARKKMFDPAWAEDLGHFHAQG